MSLEAKWLVGIILKDLKLDIFTWLIPSTPDRSLFTIHECHSDLKIASQKYVEHISKFNGKQEHGNMQENIVYQPQVELGIPIALMACSRLNNILHAYHTMKRHDCHAERQYDGEIMQGRIWQSGKCFKIFSRSKRNSTLDRLYAHPILLATFGLAPWYSRNDDKAVIIAE
jgi:hypothetical protein